jgi:hypothetical protein
MSSLLLIVVPPALLLRIWLDRVYANKLRWFDLSYAGLFLVLGAILLRDETSTFAPYACFALVISYLYNFIKESRKRTVVSKGNPNA